MGVLLGPLYFFQSSSTEFRLWLPRGSPKGLHENGQTSPWGDETKLWLGHSGLCKQAPVQTVKRSSPGTGRQLCGHNIPGAASHWTRAWEVVVPEHSVILPARQGACCGELCGQGRTPMIPSRPLHLRKGPSQLPVYHLSAPNPPFSPSSVLWEPDPETCPITGWYHPRQALQGRWGKGVPLGSSVPSPDPSGSGVCAR